MKPVFKYKILKNLENNKTIQEMKKLTVINLLSHYYRSHTNFQLKINLIIDK